MEDYQDMTAQVGADIGSVPVVHSRYSRHHSHYGPNSYAQGNMIVHGQTAPSGPVSGYEWNAYAAAQGQDAYMHNSAMVRQPLPPGAGMPTGPAYSTATSKTTPLRNKISERLQQIDREAFESEERRYQQRADDIQNELMLILRGTHPVFVEGVAQLAAERDRRISSAEQNHQYLVDVYEKTYRAEREQAEKAYKNEKQAAYEKIAADIEDRRKRLKEEKDSVDINVDFVFDSGSRSSAKRNLRKRGMDPLGLGDSSVGSGTTRHQTKRKNAQAFLLQGIPEDDIVNDLVALRRATGVTGPLSGAANGKKGAKGNKRQ
ncbi:hypothetical protein IW140_002651 [Coemansia sp. RSA 1813]|nr:hypothetical protein EV178_000272 [Coemansia sp. RSA 1646]KAJ1772082.1 hypothetical protein LPJ74_001818 [Coemansia sp. RSA 1843]KAJ2090420.1 hypothetical protein IW138_002631 [Coemansia sp. RSA 986]KAJ2215386.1 hypothetical protein EV179_002170 [Coemansia sp. RSA 487]KAJ2569975.1 hypothetical protein IW140_002651 [Coemansia sp. RSA 1813]